MEGLILTCEQKWSQLCSKERPFFPYHSMPSKCNTSLVRRINCEQLETLKWIKKFKSATLNCCVLGALNFIFWLLEVEVFVYTKETFQDIKNL